MSVTNPLSTAPLEIRSLIRSVANRLRSEFAGIFGEETIQRYIAESYESLSDAKVKGFIPLFTSALPASGSGRLRGSRER